MSVNDVFVGWALSHSPTWYYPLRDTGGSTLLDASAHGRDGTNAGVLTGQPGYTYGATACENTHPDQTTALLFPQVGTAYPDVPSNNWTWQVAYYQPTDAVGGWLATPMHGGGYGGVGVGVSVGSAAPGVQLYAHGSGIINNFLTFSGPVTVGWHLLHVTCATDSANVHVYRIYLDGEQVAVRDDGGFNYGSKPTVVLFGAAFASNKNTLAKVADWAVYPTPLSAPDVAEGYAAWVASAEDPDAVPPAHYDVAYVPKEMAAAVRLSALQVWSELPAAGGERLAYLPVIVGASDIVELGGREQLTATVPRYLPVGPAHSPKEAPSPAAWDTVAERRVLRASFSDGSNQWYRVLRTEVAASGGGVLGTITADSILADLNRSLVKRHEADGSVTCDWTLYDLTPAEHLAAILASAPAYVVPGTVGGTTRIPSLPYKGTVLSMVVALATAAGLEYEVSEAEDGTFRVDLPAQRGATAERPRLRLGRNLQELKVAGDATDQVSRISPYGPSGTDGPRQTIADAAWAITEVDLATGWLTLAGGPIGFDGQLEGLWVEILAVGVIGQALETAHATQRVRVSPAAAANAAPVDNILPNPYLTDWADGLPVAGQVVGAAVLTKYTGDLYAQHGSVSVHVAAGADGDGWQTTDVPLAVLPSKPYGTAMVALYVVSGTVRAEYDLWDGGGYVTIPESEHATTSLTGQWVSDLAIAGVDISQYSPLSVRMRLLAHGGPAEWYVDAVQFTQTSSGADAFYLTRGSCDLWRAGNRALAERSFGRATYEATVTDLQRLDPVGFRYDALEVGGTAEVHLPTLAARASVRIVSRERDLRAPERTTVRLAALPKDLAEVVLPATASTIRRIPTPRNGGNAKPRFRAAPEAAFSLASRSITVTVDPNPAGKTWGVWARPGEAPVDGAGVPIDAFAKGTQEAAATSLTFPVTENAILHLLVRLLSGDGQSFTWTGEVEVSGLTDGEEEGDGTPVPTAVPGTPALAQTSLTSTTQNLSATWTNTDGALAVRVRWIIDGQAVSTADVVAGSTSATYAATRDASAHAVSVQLAYRNTGGVGAWTPASASVTLPAATGITATVPTVSPLTPFLDQGGGTGSTAVVTATWTNLRDDLAVRIRWLIDGSPFDTQDLAAAAEDLTRTFALDGTRRSLQAQAAYFTEAGQGPWSGLSNIMPLQRSGSGL